MLDSLDKYTEQVGGQVVGQGSSLLPEGPQPQKGCLSPLQVRTNLFCNLMSSLAGSADPQVLAAMVALADVSYSSGTEQWVAQCANKYM
jgi:hypothetical protein